MMKQMPSPTLCVPCLIKHTESFLLFCFNGHETLCDCGFPCPRFSLLLLCRPGSRLWPLLMLTRGPLYLMGI